MKNQSCKILILAYNISEKELSISDCSNVKKLYKNNRVSGMDGYFLLEIFIIKEINTISIITNWNKLSYVTISISSSFLILIKRLLFEDVVISLKD